MAKEKRNALNELLAHPEKKINESENILTTMIRNIMITKDMKFSQISELLHRWLTSLYAGVKPSHKSGARFMSDYNNFMKQVAQNKVSPTVFMRFISMLGAKRFRLTLTLYYDTHKDPEKSRTEEYTFTGSTVNAQDVIGDRFTEKKSKK